MISFGCYKNGTGCIESLTIQFVSVLIFASRLIALAIAPAHFGSSSTNGLSASHIRWPRNGIGSIFELISKMVQCQFVLACVIAAAIGCLLSETTEAMLSSAIPLVSGIGITRKPPRKPPDKIKNSNQTRRRFFWILFYWIHQEQSGFVFASYENNNIESSFFRLGTISTKIHYSSETKRICIRLLREQQHRRTRTA